MAIKLPHCGITKGPASAPKARQAAVRKIASLRGFLPSKGGQCCPPHCPPRPGAVLREPGASWRPAGAGTLGPPMDIRAAARLIGCSPWTVRQTLIPRGLPHLRLRAGGRLVFYEGQLVRWIERQQGGNK